MSADHTRGSGALRCLDQMVWEGGRVGIENYFDTQHSCHFKANGTTTQHTLELACAQNTHKLDRDNGFMEVGATALAPVLSRLTGLTTLDLRCAPPRVSDLSRLSRSGTVREMHGEETMEGQGEGEST